MTTSSICGLLYVSRRSGLHRILIATLGGADENPHQEAVAEDHSSDVFVFA